MQTRSRNKDRLVRDRQPRALRLQLFPPFARAEARGDVRGVADCAYTPARKALLSRRLLPAVRACKHCAARQCPATENYRARLCARFLLPRQPPLLRPRTRAESARSAETKPCDTRGRSENLHSPASSCLPFLLPLHPCGDHARLLCAGEPSEL